MAKAKIAYLVYNGFEDDYSKQHKIFLDQGLAVASFKLILADNGFSMTVEPDIFNPKVRTLVKSDREIFFQPVPVQE